MPSRVDPTAGAIQLQCGQIGMQPYGLRGQACLDGAIQENIVGAAQINAAKRIFGFNHCGVVKHQAVEVHIVDQRAVTALQHHLIGRLNQALDRERAARLDSHIAASAACNDIALKQAVFTRIELNRTTQSFQNAGRIQVDVFAIGRYATVEVNRCVCTDFASNVKLAVRALGATDGDGGAGTRRIQGISAPRAQGCRIAKNHAQVLRIQAGKIAVRRFRGQHLDLVRAGQSDMAIAQLGFDVWRIGVGRKLGVGRANGGRGRRAIALHHLPCGGAHGSVQIRQQIRQGRVVIRRSFGNCDSRFDGEAHLVDLQHQPHIAAQLAAGGHGPACKDQLIHVARRQDVDASRRIQVDGTVLACGHHTG